MGPLRSQEQIGVPVPRDENDSVGDKDLEKASVELNGKYAKYAGEAPDGGFKAWTVILATTLTTCAAIGYVNSWGVFQGYYEKVLLPDESPSNIAWIGSLQDSLVFLPGIISGRLFDIGYFKIPYFIASCLLIVCTFLIAECKVYWQFFLAQGLGVGLGSGMLFGPALGVVSHWFSERRGLAMGITALGTSIGGTIFPIAAQNLIPLVGFKWTMRIIGFILLFLLGLANLLTYRRLPPSNLKGGMFNWAALKNPAYAVYCISGATIFLGFYTVLTYISVSAVEAGVSSSFAFYLVAIANASSAIGRIIAGILADRYGALNIMIPFTTVVGILTFVWPLATNEHSLIAVAVIYGCACGTYVSLMVVPVISMGAISDVGRRSGLFLSIATIGVLTGLPISGAISSTTDGFHAVGYYAGGTVFFSVFLLIVVRHLHLGTLWGKF